MAETKPVPAIGGSSTPTLPRWFLKTESRYDTDEVAFSPPEDGSGFFSLHFGQAQESSIASESPHKSTFDKINEELGFAEGAGRKFSVSGGGLPSRGSGLCLQAELLVHSQDQRIEEITVAEQQRHAPVKPLLVIQPFAAASASTATLPADSTAPPAAAAADLPHRNAALTPAVGDSFAATPQQKKKPHDQDAKSDEVATESEQKGFGLFEKIRNLIRKSPPSSPTYTPHPSPIPLRKAEPAPPSKAVAVPEPRSAEYQSAGGVLVERKMPTYNSFFYRPDKEVVAATGAAVTNAATAPPGAAQSVAAVQPQRAAGQPQLVDGEVAAAAAATTVTGKVRRPKPSRLREMNFWAPTSM